MSSRRLTTLDLIASVLAVGAVWHYGWRSLPPAVGAAAAVGYNLLGGLAAISCFLAADRLVRAGERRDVASWRIMGLSVAMMLVAQAVNILFVGARADRVSDLFALAFYPLAIFAFWRVTPRSKESDARVSLALDLALLLVVAITVTLSLRIRNAGVARWELLPALLARTLAPSFAIVAVAAVATWYGTVGAANRGILRPAAAMLLLVALAAIGLTVLPDLWDRSSTVAWTIGVWLLVVGSQRASRGRSGPRVVHESRVPVLVPVFAVGAFLLVLLAMLFSLRRPEPVVLAVGGAALTLLMIARHWRALRLAEALEAERDEQERHLRANERVEALGRMARGVAHDFNGMLTVILGNAELALESSADSSEVREALETIRQATLTAGGITHQLLEFSRTGAVELVDVDVRALALAHWRVLAAALPSTIRAELRATEGVLMIRAGQGFIEQVLHNLVHNARDAMPTGGTLLVDLSGSSTTVKLTITDSGSGMDEATRNRIFEPFYSIKGAAGTGLGLATVNAIVRQCGGDIRVDSTVGEGTSFVLSFPRVDG